MPRVATWSAAVSWPRIEVNCAVSFSTVTGRAMKPSGARMKTQLRSRWRTTLPAGHNAFAYPYEGGVSVGEGEDARALAAQELGVLGGSGSPVEASTALSLRAGDAGARLILVAGRPLREPVARHGPFVMNTRQELMQAFVDYQEGRF